MRPHSRQCFANHLASQWAIEPQWAERMLAQVKATGLPSPAKAWDEDDGAEARDPMDAVREIRNGVCIISIDGPMTKFDSSMGGANTVRIRAAVRSAMTDETVSCILIRADSPGGTVDGTKELADDVAMANKVKPVLGFCEDLTASAAYWVVAQARKVYANANAMIGSIGIYSAIVDSSKAYELAGLKMHLIGSGGMKGAGMDGTEITAEQLAYFQSVVDARGKFFLDAVQEGRGLSKADVKALADGRVHIASDAKRLGLIDAVGSFDEVFAAAMAIKPSRSRTRMAAALVDIETAEG